MISYHVPKKIKDWQKISIDLVNLSADQFENYDTDRFEQFKMLISYIASRKAFWHTVQLQSLAPGLLPWVVIIIGMLMMSIETGELPSMMYIFQYGDPFMAFWGFWLLGWYGLTLVFAIRKNQITKRKAIEVGYKIGIFNEDKSPLPS
jgi:hypothetical protein